MHAVGGTSRGGESGGGDAGASGASGEVGTSGTGGEVGASGAHGGEAGSSATGGAEGSAGSGGIGQECPEGSTGENCERCVVYANAEDGSDLDDGLTWASAKASLQAALDAAFAEAGKCDVWAARGAYRPTKADPFAAANTASLRMREGIALYGGFAGGELAFGARDVDRNPTVLDGEHDQVLRTVTAADGARLDGLTIRAGGVAGMVVVSSGSFEVAFCRFTGLTRKDVYSDVYSGATLVVSDSVFEGGQDTTINNQGTLVVRRSIFRDNVTPDAGAAIASTGPVEITDSSFIRNESTGRYGPGGTVYLAFEHLSVIERSVFRDNRIVGDPAADSNRGTAHGAAIEAVLSSRLVIRDSIFENNVARANRVRGGAVAAEYLTIIDSEFVDNHAEGNDEAFGGAVNAERAADIVGSAFRGNSARLDGGALRCALGCRVVGTVFQGNDSTSGRGGAVYATSTASSTLTNCSFAWNTSGLDGGAIANITSGAGSVTVTSSTLYGNSAVRYGGGLYDINNADASVSNSIFWANVAGTEGPQIFNASGATATVVSSNVQGTGFTGASGNIDSDPLFVNTTPAAPDLRLKAASPSVDTGDEDRVPLDVLDVDADRDVSEPLPLDLSGDSRVQGSGVDMGAYER